MSKYLDGIAYLESEDFTPDGRIKPEINRGKPVVVMIYGSYCPACSHMLPTFGEVSRGGEVMYACILIDGNDSEKNLGRSLGGWSKNWGQQFQAVPTVMAFGRDGRYISTYEGRRDKNSLQAFVRAVNTGS